MTGRKHPVFQFTAIAIAVTILAFVGIKAKRWVDPYDGRDFDRVVWDADPGGYDRAAMCTDIIERHLRPGMTLDQITDLLGDTFTEVDRARFRDRDQFPGVRQGRRTLSRWYS